jgi:hypothetical protein
MIASDAPFLDALAACLGAGVPLQDALSRIERAGFAASRWVQRVRPFVRPESSVESALLGAGAIDATEHALLAAAVTPDAVESLLHALVLRRRRRSALRAVVLRGLAGPFAIAALTVVLDPLPNLIGSGSYVWPVFRGLVVLGLVTALVVLGIPALVRSPNVGPRLLMLCARVPVLDWLAARHAEGELVTMSAPFVARPGIGSAGLVAASATLAWSPLGEKIRVAGADGAAPASVLERLAPCFSLATNLSIVGGIASNDLATRLAARGEEIAAELSAHVRIGVRVAAYVFVGLLTLQSLANLFSRALPGGGLLPGVVPSAEQRDLDEVMKELEGPPPRAPSK